MKTLALSIAAYNQEKYLDRCIESLIVDSIDDLEIFIVNDGSKDRTSEIAHKWAERYPQSIFVIDKPNGHYGSCCNASLERATAQYFRLLDADDYFDKAALEEYLAKLRTCNADMVITGHVICGANPRLITAGTKYNGRTFQLRDVDFSDGTLPRCYGMHGVTYALSVLKQCGLHLTEGCCATDTEYAYFPLIHAQTIAFYDLPLYQYQTDIEGQDTAIVSEAQKEQRYKVAQRMFDHYMQNMSADANIRNAQRVQVSRILVCYYGIYICNFANNKFDDQRIAQMDATMKQHDTELYAMLDSVYNCKCHFIKRYRATGHTQRWLMSLLGKIRRLIAK